MTGELTLTGKVLSIGGLKEKTLAAYRGGIRNIIIPKENEKDIPDIPDNIRNKIIFYPVKNMNEAIEKAFNKTSNIRKQKPAIGKNKKPESTSRSQQTTTLN
jgi:ATP-dependent Lon protease